METSNGATRGESLQNFRRAWTETGGWGDHKGKAEKAGRVPPIYKSGGDSYLR